MDRVIFKIKVFSRSPDQVWWILWSILRRRNGSLEEITKSALINDDPTSDEGGWVTQTHSNNQRVKYGNVHNQDIGMELVLYLFIFSLKCWGWSKGRMSIAKEVWIIIYDNLDQAKLFFGQLCAPCSWSCIINGLHYTSSRPLPTHNRRTWVSPARSLVNPKKTGFSFADSWESEK